jgi:anti-sigma regulatory factor (Ser/Thr protein kinase)
VNAAGLMLDRADREGGLTSELVDDVAERIAGSVERFLGGGSSALPVIERLAEVRALWAGVCSVVLELDEGAGARIDADTVTRDAIVDLVTEACANAVVHGAADSVLVRVHVEGDEVVLAVADDGTRRPGAAAGHDGGEGEVARRVPGGLGTEVLRMSCTEFSLDIGEQGSRLLARVPLG